MKIPYLWQSIVENGSFRIRIIRMLDAIFHYSPITAHDSRRISLKWDS